MTDTERLDWLEAHLMSMSHDRATCSVHMDGKCVHGQFDAYIDGKGRFFRVNHRSIREAIDDAFSQSNP